MKTTALLLAATAVLSADSPIGISTPLGSEHVFNKGLASIRFSVLANEEPAGLAMTAKENDTELFAVIRAEDIASMNFATAFGGNVTHFETLAHKTTREANPAARTGISIAHYDLQFLDACLRDGAVGQFDFVSLSPFPVSPDTYRILPGALTTVRKLLDLHGLPTDTPLQITLTGHKDQVVLAAASARAAGFDRVFIEATAETLANIPQKSEPAPVRKSLVNSTSVSIALGETNQANGIEQILPSDTPWDTELKANRLRLSATPPVFRTAFLADPTFLDPRRKTYEITVEAKRLPSDDGLQNATGLTLTYEATHGLRTADLWAVPGDNKWHTQTWKITDTRFTAKLGWHFILDASGNGNDVLIRMVKVSR